MNAAAAAELLFVCLFVCVCGWLVQKFIKYSFERTEVGLIHDCAGNYLYCLSHYSFLFANIQYHYQSIDRLIQYAPPDLLNCSLQQYSD